MAKERKANNTDALLAQLLRKKRLQILTLDERWHRLFTEEDKTERLKKLEAEVNKLLKKQGQVNTDLKDIKKVKSRLMQNIMDNMEGTMGDSEKTREKRLDKSQKLIREANDKIARLELQAEEVPEKLEKCNAELLVESMALCYERIIGNKEEIDELTEWIEETRMELKRKLVRKQEIEAENSAIYSNLHDMLGPELTEYFDAEYGEAGEM